MPMPEDNVNHSTGKCITTFELFAPIFCAKYSLYHCSQILYLNAISASCSLFCIPNFIPIVDSESSHLLYNSCISS